MKKNVLTSAICLMLSVGCSKDESVKPPGLGVGSTEAEPREATEEEYTSLRLEQTILSSFVATKVELSEALEFLSAESKKYGDQIGYTPVSFRAVGGMEKKLVTLTVEQVSMKTVCEVLREQLGCDLTYGENEVVFLSYDID